MWTVTLGSLNGVSQSVADQALAVTQAAAEYWRYYIDDSLANIEIEISFAPLPFSYSDSSTTYYYRDSANGLNFYESAAKIELATGVDPNSSAPDFTLVIDKDTIDAGGFYYGLPTDGYISTPSPFEIDLFTVILHEIAHGLGLNTFIGASATDRTAFDEFVSQDANGYWFDLGGLSIPLADEIEFTASGLLGTTLTNGGTFFIFPGDVSILEKIGIPVNHPTINDDILYGFIGPNYIDLLAGNDLFNGLFDTTGVISGGDGDDTISGGGELDGDAGADYIVNITAWTSVLRGGDGDDKLVGGGELGDNLDGGAGRDTLKGGDGDDVLTGGAGNDRIVGGAGLDIAAYYYSGSAIFADLSAGIISGGDAAGDKLLSIEGIAGSSFNDTLIGDSNANLLEGSAGSDLLIGGAGDDTIRAGERIGGFMDTVIGGAGADSFELTYGTSVIISYAGSTSVHVDLANFIASGGDAQGDILSQALNIEGSDRSDFIAGDENYNILFGDAGSDTLHGAADNDSLYGGAQRDLIFGDIGDDFVDAGTGNDSVDGGGQRDSVFGGSGFDLIDGGAGNDTLTGGTDGDTLLGGAGFDILQGDAGDDVLNGGASNDVVFGNAGNDTIVFELGGGIDTLRDFAAGAASEDVINLVGFGAAFDTFAEVIAAASQTGNHVTIDFGNGDALVIRKTLVGDLHADDFAFG